jgi:ribonucleotide reductase beta subunit family protein with ferritin-like domain
LPELSVDLRRIGGAFSVEENARRIAHFRYAELKCMEALAGWPATMPSIKVKLGMGEQAYQDALHADALGRRLPELRDHEKAQIERPPMLRGSEKALPPNAEFEKFIETLHDEEDELLRIVGLYRVLKTHLAVYYRHHMAVTDQISDAPTVRTIKFILYDEEEHLKWGQAIYEELANTVPKRRRALDFQKHLEELLVEAGGIHGLRE